MKTDSIIIEESDIQVAQSICNVIDDAEHRNRSVANVLAANVAAKFFDDKYDIDFETGLHNIGKVLEDIDLADIYINNHYVDVRLFFNNNEISVPKSHFDNGLLPYVYMFIKLSSDLANAEIAGFIKPKDINIENAVDSNYIVPISSLSSFQDVESVFIDTVTLINVTDFEIYSYIDNSLPDKYEFYKKLLTSKVDRCKLAKAIKANTVFSSLPISEQSTVESANYEDGDTDSNEGIISEDDFADLMDFSGNNENTSVNNEQYSTVATPSLDETDLQNEEDEIDSLFEEKGSEQTTIPAGKKKSGPNIFIIILLLILLTAAGAYYGYPYYSQYLPQEIAPVNDNIQDPAVENKQGSENKNIEAMPVESVEKTEKNNSKEEGVSIDIPAIEKNLDASITVSNLKVNWSVPSGYVNNTAAKRYLITLGKVIQLNLKTELMLLSKIPITNKISVEIKYNNITKKFEAVGLLNSSGDKSIDDVILSTINSTLKKNISSNTDSFNNMQENLILIIHL